METVIVTRHPGTVAWLAQRGITGSVIAHACPDDVRDKHVYGVIPLRLAAVADLVTIVDMSELTPEQRGRDLSPPEMDAAGAVMCTYCVEVVPPQQETER